MAYPILSPTVSTGLRDALAYRSFDYYIADGHAFYDGSILLTRITEPLNNYFRASNNELYDRDDPDCSRAWTAPELQHWIDQNTPGGTPTFESFNLGLSRRCRLTISETEFTGEQLIGVLDQDQADMEAFALAVIEYLESL